MLLFHSSSSRTVFILSEALDEQLKALWYSPFQTDELETDLDMVSVDLKASNIGAESFILILLNNLLLHFFLLLTKSNFVQVFKCLYSLRAVIMKYSCTYVL